MPGGQLATQKTGDNFSRDSIIPPDPDRFNLSIFDFPYTAIWLMPKISANWGIEIYCLPLMMFA